MAPRTTLRGQIQNTRTTSKTQAVTARTGKLPTVLHKAQPRICRQPHMPRRYANRRGSCPRQGPSDRLTPRPGRDAQHHRSQKRLNLTTKTDVQRTGRKSAGGPNTDTRWDSFHSVTTRSIGGPNGTALPQQRWTVTAVTLETKPPSVEIKTLVINEVSQRNERYLMLLLGGSNLPFHGSHLCVVSTVVSGTCLDGVAGLEAQGVKLVHGNVLQDLRVPGRSETAVRPVKPTSHAGETESSIAQTVAGPQRET